MSWPQLQIGLSESRKPYLNLCSRRWLKPTLSLVSNLTLLGLCNWIMTFEKTASRRMYKFQKLFLKDIHIFWVIYILVPLVPFQNYRREKVILEKIVFYFELRSVISISCVVWSHGRRNNFESIFWIMVSEYFKEAA